MNYSSVNPMGIKVFSFGDEAFWMALSKSMSEEMLFFLHAREHDVLNRLERGDNPAQLRGELMAYRHILDRLLKATDEAKKIIQQKESKVDET